LCKITDIDSLYAPSFDPKSKSNSGMNLIKQKIEKNTRSYFIDGDINVLDKAEIHQFYNQDTNETMIDGNIIFQYSNSIDMKIFSNREIGEQRICAIEEPDTYVRVFYKLNNKLRSALWNEGRWEIEEMFETTGVSELSRNFNIPVNSIQVKGGFGDDAF